MFREQTVYLIVCDTSGCGTVYEYYDDDADMAFELRLETPDLTTWQKSLTEDGWHVGTRVLCPPCAMAQTDAVLARMAVDLPQAPLWRDGDPAVDEPEHLRGRRVETVPLSIDEWQD